MPSELEMCVNANSFTSRREQFVETAQIQQAFVAGHRQIKQLRAGALGEQLPRDDVAVVLHLGEQDLIAGLEVLACPRLRDQIDAFGRAAGENDFVCAARIEEFRRARPRAASKAVVARLLSS